MKSIEVNVSMQNGSGMGIFIKVDNISLFFNQSESQYIDLPPGNYTATIGGHEPSSASVTIQFIDNGSVIGSQAFNTPTFFGYIPFTVR